MPFFARKPTQSKLPGFSKVARPAKPCQKLDALPVPQLQRRISLTSADADLHTAVNGRVLENRFHFKSEPVPAVEIFRWNSHPSAQSNRVGKPAVLLPQDSR
jgi:hypothetical protein